MARLAAESDSRGSRRIRRRIGRLPLPSPPPAYSYRLSLSPLFIMFGSALGRSEPDETGVAGEWSIFYFAKSPKLPKLNARRPFRREHFHPEGLPSSGGQPVPAGTSSGRPRGRYAYPEDICGIDPRIPARLLVPP